MALFSICIISNLFGKRDRVMPVIHGIKTSTNGGIIRRNRRRPSQMQVMLVCQAKTEYLLPLPFYMFIL
jgi:hypothetical protein